MMYFLLFIHVFITKNISFLLVTCYLRHRWKSS